MNDLVILPSLAEARRAGRAWAAERLQTRLRVIASLRRLIAREASTLAATIARPAADTLAAEVLPLAEAALFLLRAAPGVLRPRRLRVGRPLWLFGVRQEIRREPRGAVLILAPGNYPLFLPGTQALQAIAAGNAVRVKPAPGASAPMLALADLLRRAGLPDGVFDVLDESDGPAATASGYDFIVLTGGAETGRYVLRTAAESLTPTAMELSGVDAVFVLPGADLTLVAKCLAYGMRLNGGATCIAPRRVFVPVAMAAELEQLLLARLPAASTIAPRIADRLQTLLAQAEAQGARIKSRNPAVLAGARPEMTLLQEDVFAPWLAFVPVADTEAALQAAQACPFALGASVFGPQAAALDLAARVRAGSVCINDLIVPTADPRLPFGGRGQSGFGVTRGAEGLLDMTLPKTISTRTSGFRPHLDDKLAGNSNQLLTLIRLLHGTWPERWRAVRQLSTSEPR